MKFRKSIEIGENVRMSPPFLPKLAVGQHITVDGNPGRFVGVTKHGTVFIVWPKTCGKKNVNEGIRRQYQALKELNR